MSLPAAFIQSTRQLLGEDAFARFITALGEEAPASIRLNPARLPDGLCLSRLEPCPPCLGAGQSHLDSSPSHLEPCPSHLDECPPHPHLHHRVPWSTQGYYLPTRPTFTFDPLLHAGCYYVQEASSMFLEQVMRQCVPDRPVLMLDLCAAPGGKSTHARSLLPQGSLLVANEVIKPRAQILAENLTKWGHPDVVVTGSDPSAFGSLRGVFDVVLADVPCSGEGMFRKDQGAIDEWSPEGVQLCAGRQRRIVADVWPALRPGGLLIYSTCTYNVHENEENVRWICQELGAEALTVDVPSDWQITGNLLGDPPSTSIEKPLQSACTPPCSRPAVYRFLPHLTQGEGLFMAVLCKVCADERVGRGEDATLVDATQVYENRLEPTRDERFSSRSKKGKPKDIRDGFTRAATASVASRQVFQTRPAYQSLSAPKNLICNWLDDPDRYDCLTQGAQVAAFPRQWTDSLRSLQAAVHIIQAGIPLAEFRGRDLIPTQALALSTALRPDAFPRVELEYRQALAYLRREAITLPDTAPRGHVLVTYRAIPLGFVKNLGTRANNLYPQEWRIRTSYRPDGEVSVI